MKRLLNLGWPEKVFLLLLCLDIALSFVPGSSLLGAIATVICAGFGFAVLIRGIRRSLKMALWGLRNRLIVCYVFIAVVPILLVALLVATAGYILMGQMAIYMVSAQLQDRSGESGAPPTPELLTAVGAGIGDVLLVEWRRGARPDPSYQNLRRSQIPPASNVFDVELNWLSPITFDGRQYALIVRSRPSAVLGLVFGQKMEWGRDVMLFSIVVLFLFLIAQVISIVVGVSITRTVTGAVHDLYEGTRRVKEGDFSHRIAVRGNDQLSELSLSFNQMTENLQRLIVVEKEKERLSSELEIAREVQRRLFPKAWISTPSLRVTGICHPASMVSGDYYDFLRVEQSSLAMAIGDVAGKGISAALLMATIQSAMHSQLAGAGPISTSEIVTLLNRQIYASTAPEKYATFYFGIYDGSSGVLTYTNAGHLPPILVRGSTATRLEVTGTVVGAFPSSPYEERQIALESGDLLLAYTDGVTEPENAYGEMFGEQRLIDVLFKYQAAEESEIISRAVEAVLQWTGSPELQDDMTMLIARGTGR